MSAPSDFIKDLVIENGGDVESNPENGQLQILVPEFLRDRLGLPDQMVTVSEAGPDGEHPEVVPLGYGAELLEKAILTALDTGRTAAVRMPDPPSRKRVGDILDRQLAFPNATYKLVAEQGSSCDYWLWTFGIIAEADERQETTCHVCISANGAACASLPELLHQQAGGWTELQVRPSEYPRDSIDIAFVAAVDAVLRRLDQELFDFRATVRRHHTRDAKRISDYFEDLRQEMALEIQRRHLKGQELEIRKEKQVAITKEEASKLAALEEKYRLRLAIEPRALLLARLPVTRCDLIVKRRKGERRISAAFNLLTKHMDPLVCEACGAGTLHPGFCDTKLHLLCEKCLSHSGGRGMPLCPACKGEAPPTGVALVLKRRGIKERRPMEVPHESVG